MPWMCANRRMQTSCGYRMYDKICRLLIWFRFASQCARTGTSTSHFLFQREDNWGASTAEAGALWSFRWYLFIPKDSFQCIRQYALKIYTYMLIVPLSSTIFADFLALVQSISMDRVMFKTFKKFTNITWVTKNNSVDVTSETSMYCVALISTEASMLTSCP